MTLSTPSSTTASSITAADILAAKVSRCRKAALARGICPDDYLFGGRTWPQVKASLFDACKGRSLPRAMRIEPLHGAPVGGAVKLTVDFPVEGRLALIGVKA